MANILSVLARVYVDDVEVALPLYEQLADATPHRFDFRDLRLAVVGPFLLIEGADDEIRSHSATLSVRDLGPVLDALLAAGGEALEGPDDGPNGRRLIARQPHGETVLEYIELVDR
ncbi:MAG: hypothetical protein AAGC46_14265 [Solirubrobacteraceae bacterium]|nr:hypothetical protein [Patulibacter sp.]